MVHESSNCKNDVVRIPTELTKFPSLHINNNSALGTKLFIRSYVKTQINPDN